MHLAFVVTLAVGAALAFYVPALRATGGDWPAPLDGGVKLQLTITGVVVRTNGTATALEILGHEFRTRRVGPKAAPPQESVG